MGAIYSIFQAFIQAHTLVMAHAHKTSFAQCLMQQYIYTVCTQTQDLGQFQENCVKQKNNIWSTSCPAHINIKHLPPEQFCPIFKNFNFFLNSPILLARLFSVFSHALQSLVSNITNITHCRTVCTNAGIQFWYRHYLAMIWHLAVLVHAQFLAVGSFGTRTLCIYLQRETHQYKYMRKSVKNAALFLLWAHVFSSIGTCTKVPKTGSCFQ